MTNKQFIVLFSTAQWDNPFWTNKQHVALNFGKSGHRVLYIDSIGLRRATATKSDVLRIFKRLAKALILIKRVHKNIYVWSPLVLPAHKNKIISKINKLSFSLSYKIISIYLNIQKPLLWTYSPLTTLFFNLKNFSKTAYHCVDEISEQPYMPKLLIQSKETELLKQVDCVFVTSKSLLNSKKKLNKHTYYFSNVVDFSHFNQAQTCQFKKPDDLIDLKGPIVGFIGAISHYKLNFEIINHITSKLDKIQFVFIGKVGEGEPSTLELNKKKNLHLIGPKHYDLLPKYLKFFNAAIIPAAVNSYTKNMFPMKFFEYLAAGVPVVSTKLHSLQDFEDYYYSALSPEEFEKQIQASLQTSQSFINKAIELSKNYTYESRNKKMLDILNKLD